MKRLLVLLLPLIFALSSIAQGQGRDGTSGVAAATIRGMASNPAGVSCAPESTGAVAVRVYSGGFYICSGGVYVAVSGGGATINSTNGQVPYRVNSTTFGDSAISSNALNATGISVTSAAVGSGVTISTTSSGTNENMTLSPKGTGAINFTGAMKGPNGSASTPTYGFTNVSGGGFYFGGSAGRFILAAAGTAQLEFANSLVTAGSNLHYGWASSISPSGVNPDTSWTRFGAAVIRAANGSTGAGQLLLGTSTDTADAQLSVYSQSTTRSGLKLRALSGTAGSQNVFESYDAAGTLTVTIKAGGSITTIGAAGTADITAGGDLYSGNGQFYVSRNLGTIQLGSVGKLGFTSTSATGTLDTILERDAANTLAQRNGTNAQTFRIYNTFTDASNYERATLTWSGNVAYLRNQNAGTGSARLLIPVTGATTVAGLPSAATAGAGARAFVTDANTTLILGIGTAVVGGGSNSVPVYSDGTNWLIG